VMSWLPLTPWPLTAALTFGNARQPISAHND
jgi:hypothetical protein